MATSDYVLLPNGYYSNSADGTGPYVRSGSGVFTLASTGSGGGGGGAGDASAANQVTGNASLASIDGKTPALGQQLAAASSPIVLTAAQLATLTPPAAITGFATSAKQPALGAALSAASTPVVTATDDVIQGALTETAPATDTASSGHNGRLQRIAQRLTSLIAQLPSTLGIKTAANSLSIAPASDGVFSTTSANSEVRLSTSFVRPADTTAYAVGDLVANNTTAGSVVALTFANAVRTAGDCVRIERARITKTSTPLTNAIFRLHLFETVPVPSVGDNAAFDSSGALSTTGALVYAGAVNVTMGMSGSDGATGRGVPDFGAGITLSPTSGTSIFGLLEAQGAYTPVSGETFAVILEGYRT